MEIRATVKSRRDMRCGCMNEYEECHNCREAEKSVKVDEPLEILLNMRDNEHVKCLTSDDMVCFINREFLENWEVR